MDLGDTLDQEWTRQRLAEQGKPVPGLLLISSAGKPACKPIPIEKGPLVIGRATVGSEALDDGCMSRRHAEVTFERGRFSVRDLGSRNGTALEGVAVHEERAHDGDGVLRAGDTLFLLLGDLRPFLLTPVEDRGGVVMGPRLRAALDQVQRAGQDGDVLHISGETGTGKEVAARAFHTARGGGGPFVAVNCATIPAALAERLLFGAKKGAYSGADADTEGHVQAADGGTLFLDEVAELDPSVQAKLLRTIEHCEVTPVGASKPRKVQVRFVSATHGELRALVGQGKFREDLFFRMGRPDVALPPLRERKEEIPLLIQRALEGLPAHASLVEAALLRPWPGNIRELLLEVREASRAARTAGATRVEASHLSPRAGQARSAAHGGAMPAPSEPPRAAPGRDEIEAALRAEEGNVARAARKLAVHRTQLRRWLQRLAIDPRSFVNPKHQRTVEQDDEDS